MAGLLSGSSEFCFWTGIFDRGLAGCLKAIYWTDHRSYTSLFTFHGLFFFVCFRVQPVGCFWSYAILCRML